MPLLEVPLCPGVIVPVRDPFKGQIERFKLLTVGKQMNRDKLNYQSEIAIFKPFICEQINQLWLKLHKNVESNIEQV